MKKIFFFNFMHFLCIFYVTGEFLATSCRRQRLILQRTMPLNFFDYLVELEAISIQNSFRIWMEHCAVS